MAWTSTLFSDKDGRTALHLAIYWSHPEVALKLIHGGANANIKDNTGSSSLHDAARRGLKDTIDALLKHDVDINAVDKEGRTALHKADTAEIALKLIHEGAETNVRDNAGRLPLHEAADRGYEEVVEQLVKLDVDINAVDKEGRTPLEEAKQPDHHGIVKILLQKKGGKILGRVEKPLYTSMPRSRLRSSSSSSPMSMQMPMPRLRPRPIQMPIEIGSKEIKSRKSMDTRSIYSYSESIKKIEKPYFKSEVMLQGHGEETTEGKKSFLLPPPLREKK